MKTRIGSLFVVGILLTTIGCGDPYEDTVEEALEVQKESLRLLSKIKDGESAREVFDELSSLKERMVKTKDRMIQLGEPPEEEGKALAEKYGQKLTENGLEIMSRIQHLAKNPEISKVLAKIYPEEVERLKETRKVFDLLRKVDNTPSTTDPTPQEPQIASVEMRMFRTTIKTGQGKKAFLEINIRLEVDPKRFQVIQRDLKAIDPILRSRIIEEILMPIRYENLGSPGSSKGLSRGIQRIANEVLKSRRSAYRSKEPVIECYITDMRY